MLTFDFNRDADRLLRLDVINGIENLVGVSGVKALDRQRAGIPYKYSVVAEAGAAPDLPGLALRIGKMPGVRAVFLSFDGGRGSGPD